MTFSVLAFLTNSFPWKIRFHFSDRKNIKKILIFSENANNSLIELDICNVRIVVKLQFLPLQIRCNLRVVTFKTIEL